MEEKNRRTPVVRTEKVSKTFSGIKVLKDVSFELGHEEIHALVGENGAGKSTLMKIISGVYRPSEGSVFLNGEKVDISTPHKARGLGIVLIHQEPLTFPDLDVAENIYMGHTRHLGKYFFNRSEMYTKARELLNSLGVAINERARIKGMSIANQQMVEIASALSQDAKIIVMDEPTASITNEEVSTLFKIIRLLRDQGRSIIFISHRLDEIKEISDRVTVLRDGEMIGAYETAEISKDEMIHLMIGRAMSEQAPKTETAVGDVALEIENFTIPGQFDGISLNVRKGEIVGLTGLVGSGRSEVARAVFGVTRPTKGVLYKHGKIIRVSSPKSAIKNGIAYVPEDRQQQGLFLPISILKNTTYAILGKISRVGWIDFDKEKFLVRQYIETLRVRLRSEVQPVRTLSGGNQQKVVLAKWLLTNPEILILDEPTRGIDVGAKAEVYRIINRLAEEGKAILMISSEMQEIIGLCDRVYVMREGKIDADFDRESMTETNIMQAASGEFRSLNRAQEREVDDEKQAG